jgi:hypothetical protein
MKTLVVLAALTAITGLVEIAYGIRYMMWPDDCMLVQRVDNSDRDSGLVYKGAAPCHLGDK